MNKEYNDIQKEIDNLMNSKWAKNSDKWIQSYDKMVQAGKNSKTKSQGKKVDQFDLDGNYIKTFDSLNDVVKFYKIDKSAIRMACLGKQKTSCGFIWKFHN